MPLNDEYLTRREATERADAHLREHSRQDEAIDKAMTAEKVLREAHDTAHAAANHAHEEKHGASEKAVTVALSTVASERKIHAEAHEREHQGHQREHGMAQEAIGKAETATNQRFNAANGYREAYESRVNNAASKDALEGLRKEFDRRLTAVENNDIKSEGRGMGQNALVAYVVAGLSIFGSLVIVVNLLTNR